MPETCPGWAWLASPGYPEAVALSIEIRMTGHDAEEELRSLYAWLHDEPDVQRSARMSLTSGGVAPGEGQMGGGPLDIMQVVVGDGFQALNFALAYVACRGTRAKPVCHDRARRYQGHSG